MAFYHPALASIAKNVNDQQLALATRANGSILSSTTLQKGTMHFILIKDGTTATGAYMTGVARNENVCLFLNFLLDNSGSMQIACGAGSTRFQVVLKCMEKLCSSPIIRQQDYMTVHTCNGDVRWRASCPAMDYNHGRLERTVAAQAGNTGQTRLWDGILTSYLNMKDHGEDYRGGRKVLRYMLAFTDGGDNASKTEIDKLANTLAHSGLANFHVVVIAAGLSSYDTQKLEKLLQPQHCKLISVSSAADDIIKAFDEALVHMRTLVMQLSNGQQHIIQHMGSGQGALDFDAIIGKQMQKNFSSLKISDAGSQIFNLQAITGGGGGRNGRSQSAQRGRGDSNDSGGSRQRGRSQSRNGRR